MEGPQHSAARQKVHAAAAQLPRARAGEHVTLGRARLDEVVDYVEQLGHPLDLVDHDVALRLGSAPHQFAQPFRPRRHLAEVLGAEEVDPAGVLQEVGEPGGLTRAAGPEKEEVVCRRQAQKSRYYRHFAPQNSVAA